MMNPPGKLPEEAERMLNVNVRSSGSCKSLFELGDGITRQSRVRGVGQDRRLLSRDGVNDDMASRSRKLRGPKNELYVALTISDNVG